MFIINDDFLLGMLGIFNCYWLLTLLIIRYQKESSSSFKSLHSTLHIWHRNHVLEFWQENRCTATTFSWIWTWGLKIFTSVKKIMFFNVCLFDVCMMTVRVLNWLWQNLGKGWGIRGRNHYIWVRFRSREEVLSSFIRRELGEEQLLVWIERSQLRWPNTGQTENTLDGLHIPSGLGTS